MRYKLKDIFDLQMGRTPSRDKKDYWNTNDNKWISIADLTKSVKYVTNTKEYISDSAVIESGIKIIPAKTVVMSFKLSIGKTAITSEDMYSNEAIMAFHDKHVVELLPDYIYYMFKYKKWDNGSNTAVKGKTLNKAILLEHEIEICSLEKQKYIVKILDKVSSILEDKNHQLALLDELVKARFIEMFGYIEDIGKWNRKQWNEVLTIKNGKDYKHIIVNDGGYPVYGTGGEIARANDYLCPENTVIVGRKGTINNPLLVKEKFWNVDTAFGVIPGEEIHYQYLYYFCKMFNFEKLNKAAVLPSTTKGDLLKIEMNIPPITLQNQFALFVKQVDKSRYVSGFYKYIKYKQNKILH